MCVTPKDIHAKMVAILWDSASALSTGQKWRDELRKRKESLEDDPNYQLSLQTASRDLKNHRNFIRPLKSPPFRWTQIFPLLLCPISLFGLP